jgi:glycosyltransferase involved in cell wall biosynthesis
LPHQSLLVILAALNEEQGIRPSLAELRMVLDNARVLVVDGNSVDRTVEFAEEMGAEVLFQEGVGKGEAISQAIKHVNSEVIKHVIFSDADYTYPAECLPEMIRILEENPEVGMVCGNRFNRHLNWKAMKSPYYMGNRFLAWAQLLLNGIKLNDPLTGLRVVKWSILKSWEPKSKGFDIEAEMNYRVEKMGYKIVELPIQYRPRMGDKKLGIRHGFSILKRIVSESLTFSGIQN